MLLLVFAISSLLACTKKDEGISYELKFNNLVSLLEEKDNLQEVAFTTMPSTYNLKSYTDTSWFRLIVKDSYKEELIAYIPTHNIDLVELYQYKENEFIRIGKAGNLVPEEELAINFKFPALALPLSDSENNTFYLRVIFPKETNFPFQLLTEKGFFTKTIKSVTLLNFYYGTCLIIFLINILCFYKFKDQVYLYYALFLLAITFDFIFYNGTFIQFFRGNTQADIIEQATHLAQEIALLLFSISYLDLKEKAPKLVKVVYPAPVIMLLLYIINYWIPEYQLATVADFLGLLIFIGVWIASLYFIQSSMYAKYFFIGYFLLLLSAIYSMLAYSFGFWYINGDLVFAKIASWVDMLVFLYALAFRLKIKNIEAQQNINE